MMLKNTGIIINNSLDMEGQYFLTMKLINKFMRHGRKTVMENILLQIRGNIKNEWLYFPQKCFLWLFENIKPIMGLSSKRQGKSFTFVPSPLQNNRPIIMGLKWFMQNVKSKIIPKNLYDRMTYELAYIFFNSRFSIVQRRNAYYELVYDYRSNMRFRWT